MATHSKTETDLAEQAIALAEQLGHLAGTIQGTAETWFNRQKLTDELARVRDGASDMLERLGAGARSAMHRTKDTGVSTPVIRTADPAHAPGKRRRKPAPARPGVNARPGVKKSDTTISKMRTARTARQRRKNYA